MLNSLAYQILLLDPRSIRYVTFALFALGGVIVAAFRPSVSPKSRSRFFLLGAAAVAFYAPLQFLTLAAPWAISVGLLPALLFLKLGAATIFGAILFPVAAGRSLDAFDTPIYWFLLYVPFGFIILLFKRRAKSRRNQDAARCQNDSPFVDVSVGLILSITALVLYAKAVSATDTIVDTVSNTPEVHRLLAEQMIDATGVESTLARVARVERRTLPLRVSDALVKTDVTASGRALIETFAVDPPDSETVRLVRLGLANGGLRRAMAPLRCQDIEASVLLEAGAMFALRFTAEGSGDLGRFDITLADCDALNQDDRNR